MTTDGSSLELITSHGSAGYALNHRFSFRSMTLLVGRMSSVLLRRSLELEASHIAAPKTHVETPAYRARTYPNLISGGGNEVFTQISESAETSRLHSRQDVEIKTVRACGPASASLQFPLLHSSLCSDLGLSPLTTVHLDWRWRCPHSFPNRHPCDSATRATDVLKKWTSDPAPT